MSSVKTWLEPTMDLDREILKPVFINEAPLQNGPNRIIIH
jgi:hypothetical protein